MNIQNTETFPQKQQHQNQQAHRLEEASFLFTIFKIV